MNRRYFKEMYGKRNVDFIKGYIACLNDFGIWTNGTQIIGNLNEPIDEVKKEVIEIMAENPEYFRNI